MKKEYKIAFVGMGSIGKRHLKNVCEYMASRNCMFSIDLYRSSFKRVLPDDIAGLVNNQYLCDDAIVKTYDVVFVTNPTSKHKEIVDKFKSFTKAFFIEKPVFDKVIDDADIYDEVLSYVACPLRYNPVLQYVKNNIDVSKVFSARAMSSSYLPDWRPGQNYRQTYSAHKDMGGGVDIDLIHEWDYLTWIFGMPLECSCVLGKYSNLDVDSNDIAVYVAHNKQMVYELHLDYFGRKTQRMLDLFMADETVHCDLVSGTVSFLCSGKVMNFNSERNAFQMAEIKHFFDIVEGSVPNDSSVSHAVKVLNLTKAKV